MNNFFSIKAKYSEVDQIIGKEKRVTKEYLVDAMSVTEAEARATKELRQIVSGEFQINNANTSNIIEVYHNENGGTWHKCKVSFIDVDAVSGKEKKTNEYMLVEAENVNDAYEILEQRLNTMMAAYRIPSISESKIIDIFQYAYEEEVPEGFKKVE